MKRKNLGKLGEKLAVKELKKNKYKILERNFRSPFGEIDIIAQEGDVLVFIEVKTRWSQRFGAPEEAITPWKLRRLIRASQDYQSLHPELPELMRLDLVAIDFSPGGEIGEIRIIKNLTS